MTKIKVTGLCATASQFAEKGQGLPPPPRFVSAHVYVCECFVASYAVKAYDFCRFGYNVGFYAFNNYVRRIAKKMLAVFYSAHTCVVFSAAARAVYCYRSVAQCRAEFFKQRDKSRACGAVATPALTGKFSIFEMFAHFLFTFIAKYPPSQSAVTVLFHALLPTLVSVTLNCAFKALAVTKFISAVADTDCVSVTKADINRYAFYSCIH